MCSLQSPQRVESFPQDNFQQRLFCVAEKQQLAKLKLISAEIYFIGLLVANLNRIEERGGWRQSNLRAVNFWNKFDVNMMIYYTVLPGFLGAWDDLDTNYYLYKRTLNDGKWHMMAIFTEIS